MTHRSMLRPGARSQQTGWDLSGSAALFAVCFAGLATLEPVRAEDPSGSAQAGQDSMDAAGKAKETGTQQKPSMWLSQVPPLSSKCEGSLPPDCALGCEPDPVVGKVCIPISVPADVASPPAPVPPAD